MNTLFKKKVRICPSSCRVLGTGEKFYPKPESSSEQYYDRFQRAVTPSQLPAHRVQGDYWLCKYEPSPNMAVPNSNQQDLTLRSKLAILVLSFCLTPLHPHALTPKTLIPYRCYPIAVEILN
ncbi:MAG: hypothetical protein HWQ38_11335 [Nostoc sp. NMS7]|uniref:hypothetical protein n=1 Tax=Nostoc sp. NMS7 TaxID=2815391 RepID=UPI0025CCE4A6|nr:hypothetical protein [Nostoc sp. NMS7]MBN3947037.1 hypothetical protein [Nostoc sp. NMS7]